MKAVVCLTSGCVCMYFKGLGLRFKVFWSEIHLPVEEMKRMIEELDDDRARSAEERQRLRDEYEQKLRRMEVQLSSIRRQLEDQDVAKVRRPTRPIHSENLTADIVVSRLCSPSNQTFGRPDIGWM
eukprot:scaffold4674_cov19-Prasinocladus_malaysianus.AAC.1